MTRNQLVIWEQRHPKVRRPFRVAEVFPTCEGYRTRLTAHSFETEEAALKWIEDAQRRMAT